MSYWECLTHKCGSVNFNHLVRHEMPFCEIRKLQGTHIPKTWHDASIGGANGDVSRKFYRDWDDYCSKKQQKVQIRSNWSKQIENYESLLDKKGRRFDY